MKKKNAIKIADYNEIAQMNPLDLFLNALKDVLQSGEALPNELIDEILDFLHAEIQFESAPEIPQGPKLLSNEEKEILQLILEALRVRHQFSFEAVALINQFVKALLKVPSVKKSPKLSPIVQMIEREIEEPFESLIGRLFSTFKGSQQAPQQQQRQDRSVEADLAVKIRQLMAK